MPEYQEYTVTTSSGATGRVFRKSRFLDKSEESRVVLDDGRELVVPSTALQSLPDGSFRLDGNWDDLVSAVSEAQPASSSASGESAIGENLFSEEAEVERVAVNQLIDEPAQIRQEGDVLIVPVMEEVLTVRKQLMLKEEIRITRRRTEVGEPRRIVMNGSDGRNIER